ncbi:MULTISPECIES: nuclear transport factor 2 family protein [unclassified Rhizobium]|uniref:nuclear transport factor 2 family protein n=1 Tax=unclassified Rhizobium TaxID=2613769 RepID=UPI001ADC034D|nr:MULTISPECIES: nuclear transport factor 2 family protein [unclassified Rhizobium]MBO9099699.1 nuclear transport factor 2 family protein [Rhizobium sp. L58/93]MBO9131769.1 nuclear transport factor 2 family protein [Rhizobium sp. B209b/85]MBO9169689.1 nuclear transport factor 2 family protein [Rhizobium sp. L245/93]MBO9185647.1 nuclear transport factor 2 family protein [Rhizobium sp. E27B/91]QXZ82413.1 nuclear transport factor 2 family protein [Rhizobium sp. K1/93]
MDGLLEYLRQLEERLFDPAVRSSRATLEELLSPEFREIGSSGRMFGFDDIISALLTEEPVMSRALHNPRLVMLSEHVALVTYGSIRKTMEGHAVHSLRSSIWRQEEDGRWLMVFHQGTLTDRL